jgi:hypothetical protein
VRLMTASTSALITEEGADPAAVVFDKVSFAFDEHVVLHDRLGDGVRRRLRPIDRAKNVLQGHCASRR